MEALMSIWPDDLFDFAFVRNIDQRLDDLAAMAEPESWDYQSAPQERSKPILHNYLRYTYARLAEEERLSYRKMGST
jgi:Domain of unknown function (DUF3825)